MYGETTMAQKLAASRCAYWNAVFASAKERMRQGPCLADDGYTLVIPSTRGWYDPKASAFWRSKGFCFDRDRHEWTRDARRPLDGKPYTPAAWLEAARRQFYKFYPELCE